MPSDGVPVAAAAPEPLKGFKAGGTWVAQAGDTSFVGGGSPIVQVPTRAAHGTLRVAYQAAAPVEAKVAFYANGKESWSHVVPVNGEITLAPTDLQALHGEHSLNVVPAEGANAKVDWTVEATFTT